MDRASPDGEPRRGRAPEFSEDAILGGLRQAAAELGEPLSSDKYDAYCVEHGLVSSVRIIQRFGTWNAACAAAGLETRRGRENYARRWTEDEMAGYVADYLELPDSTGSYSGYADWAKSVDGAPSGQSVRNAFRGWANAKSAAEKVLSGRR
jgi:hypothetical protein